MKGLKRKRKEKGMSQKQLGEMLGLTFKTIYNYEAGKSEPSQHTLKTLAAFFTCSIDELM